MSGIQANMSGGRLSFVVVPQEGTVRRPVHKWKRGAGVEVKDIEEPAGFLVYFPRGHVIRIKNKKELAHYKLDREPEIVNLSGLHDRNSAMGKIMFSQDEAIRRQGMVDLENFVIRLAQAKSGKIELVRDPSDVPEMEVA